MTQQKPTSMPPASPEQAALDKQLEEARKEMDVAAEKLDACAKKARRSISDPKMRAVRLPTPSHLSLHENDETEKR